MVSVSQQTKIIVCSKPDKKREFKTEWTDKYAFVLPVVSTTLLRLICNETVAFDKSGNVTMKQSMHTSNKITPRGKGQKINQLQSSYSVIVSSATQQERAYLNILLLVCLFNHEYGEKQIQEHTHL